MEPNPEGVEVEDVSCPLGCTRDDELVITARDRLHSLPGEYTVVRCRQCGLLRTNPRPTPKSMPFYYPADYGPHRAVPSTPGSKAGLLRKLKTALLGADPFSATSLPPVETGRVLEVGCATGAYMSQLRTQGWKVHGLEASTRAAAVAKEHGFDVHCGTLEDAPDPPELFDLVVGWMVVEHLHDPIGGLKKLAKWTRPGGWIAISVPNAASIESRVFGTRWYALQVPAHLFHFTPDTVSQVLVAGGWEPQRIIHQRVLANSVQSAAYVAQDLGWEAGRRLISRFPGPRGVGNILLYPAALVLGQFGQTGRMTVWARRGGA